MISQQEVPITGGHGAVAPTKPISHCLSLALSKCVILKNYKYFLKICNFNRITKICNLKLLIKLTKNFTQVTEKNQFMRPTKVQDKEKESTEVAELQESQGKIKFLFYNKWVSFKMLYYLM